MFPRVVFIISQRAVRLNTSPASLMLEKWLYFSIAGEVFKNLSTCPASRNVLFNARGVSVVFRVWTMDKSYLHILFTSIQFHHLTYICAFLKRPDPFVSCFFQCISFDILAIENVKFIFFYSASLAPEKYLAYLSGIREVLIQPPRQGGRVERTEIAWSGLFTHAIFNTLCLSSYP